MDHHVSTVLYRTRHIRSRKSIVDDEWYAIVVRDLRNGGNIEHVAPRITDRFSVQHLGLRRDRFAKVLGIVRLDKDHIVPEPAHRDIELREGPTVESTRGDNLIARFGDRR